MTNAELGGFGENPGHPLESTQIFAGPNDGLSETFDGVSTYIGLRADSPKAGYRVIYPTLDMGRYLEIAEEDILATEDLSPAESPFGALGGTRVSVREKARIITSRAVSPAQDVDDEFDLDIRLGASGWSMPSSHPGEAMYAPGNEGEERQAAIKTNGACPPTGDTCKTCVTCGAQTCETCHTCAAQNTCHTCETACAQHTCETCQTKCGQDTCQTCKADATCVTCKTQCEQATCATCKGDATCQTCETLCEQATCGVTCHTCPDKGCPIHTQTCCVDTRH
jgi:hypothetical protein